jgi:Flp pilus assembly protein TadD
MLEREGNYEGALWEYRLAYNLDPQNAEYHISCGRLSWALPPENTLPV